MKNSRMFALVFCFLIAGCASAPKDTVFQVSTIDALLSGVYDGDTSYRNMLKHGDFGIGTFDRLDGEMVLLNGHLYQVKADGRVYQPALSGKTPFASVCRFDADQRVSLVPGADYEAVECLVDQHAPNRNLFCAIKITGDFRTVTTRSVPGQHKPYPPLKEVTSHQPEFHMTDISGTIVGFRCPAYVKGINVPGYHLHFISDDRTCGGHLLSFEVVQGFCEIDVLNQYYLTLPAGIGAFADTDLSKDRGSELHQVEKARRQAVGNE